MRPKPQPIMHHLISRFVMMSVQEGECIFNVHLPNTGEYILEIGRGLSSAPRS